MDAVIFKTLADLKSQLPLMNCDGGFTGAVIDVNNGLTVSNGEAVLSQEAYTQTPAGNSGSTNPNSYATNVMVIEALKNLSAVEVEFVAGSIAPTRLRVLPWTNASADLSATPLATAAVSGSSGWVKVAVNLVAGNKYVVAIDGNGTMWSSKYASSLMTVPANSANVNIVGFATQDGYPATTGYSNTLYCLRGYTPTAVSGSLTKDISPANLRKFLKAFFSIRAGSAGSSVRLDVLDTSNNVLLSNVADGGSLESIDTVTYKTIRLKFTLTRSQTTDTSPALLSPLWTWLGGGV